jgi:tetratricopeptide (TPR) repeat protein
MIRDVRGTVMAGWAIALVVLIFSSAAVVRADSGSPDAKRAASVHFRRGVELYQEGAYRAALIELQRANEIAPDYRVLYNVGQTHYALGEYVESIRAFEAYLSQGGAEVPAARKEEVTNSLTELNKRVATLRITVDRDGATISVDGVVAGKSPLPGAVALSVGRHSVTAELEDGSNASEIIDVAGGDQRTLSMTMSAPIVAEGAGGPPRPETWWGKLSVQDRWGYSLLATGIATGIAGGVMAGLAKKSDSDLNDALKQPQGDAGTIGSARDDLKRNSAIADALFGTAIVTGVTGLVLVLVKEKEKKPEEEKDFEVGLGFRSIVAKGRF